MQIKLKNEAEKSEAVNYAIADFPLCVLLGHLSDYPNYHIISHWHDDVELVHIQQGHMEFNINGETVRLEQGEGLFLNTRQLHHVFSSDLSECVFHTVLLHPILLCASLYIEQTYITPVTQNEAVPYLRLRSGIEQENEILQYIDALYRCYTEHMSALHMQSISFQIWERLYEICACTERPKLPPNPRLIILKDMIRFVSENYTEKLSLRQIGEAGNVGKTMCCEIFRNYTGDTPLSYLTNYRMKKSIELLEQTDQTIAEICYAAGFSGASYFAEIFHREYGCTPTEYRRRFKRK